jgi:DNA adenine methylase
LYRQALQSWQHVTFQAKTHTGLREESVWLNFDPPAQLHDGRFLGTTFRERQSVKRRHQRWIDRLDRMVPAERGHLLALIRERYAEEVSEP